MAGTIRDGDNEDKMNPRVKPIAMGRPNSLSEMKATAVASSN